MKALIKIFSMCASFLIMAGCDRTQGNSQSKINQVWTSENLDEGKLLTEADLFYKYPIQTFDNNFKTYHDFDSSTLMSVKVDQNLADKPAILKAEYSNSKGYHRTHLFNLKTGYLVYEEGQAGAVSKTEMAPPNIDPATRTAYMDILKVMEELTYSVEAGFSPFGSLPNPEVAAIREYLLKVIKQCSSE
jgi:hypothetical protein